MKSYYWKLALITATVLTTLFCIFPTFFPNFWPYKKINLGLDLQGGMHLVLEVDTDKTIETAIKQVDSDLRSVIREKHLGVLRIENMGTSKLKIIFKNKEAYNLFEELISDNFNGLECNKSNSNNNIILEKILSFSTEKTKEICTLAIEQAIEIIRNRIDEFGVNEPDIRLQGSKHILVQLPGIKNKHRAKELIGQTAMLEFKIVEGSNSSKHVIIHKNLKNKTTTITRQKAPITGAHITDARVCIDSQNNNPYVLIKLNKIGEKIFERVTTENINKRLAIILDGKIHSTPIITEKISGGQARITGGFTIEKAKDLAIVLRAGALPAPVIIVEERSVGPSLGADSIKKGIISICVGFVVVILFMLIYYKVAGIIANFAIMLNILIIAAGLACLQATLTLPGIAGIILTIGMAVDANVLIFERIREELRLGRSPMASVISGYDKATLTVIDANVTTLIASLVLFQFGTGPIKGFAITLSLGIIASLFTSLVVTRTIFDYLFIHHKIKKINI